MGRGDKKSKKGKIAKGSFGKSRSRKAIKAKMKRATSAKPVASPSTESAKPKKTRKKAEA